MAVDELRESPYLFKRKPCVKILLIFTFRMTVFWDVAPCSLIIQVY
jgi:hypothetical protein